jgi:hypothetical protein
LHLRDVDRRRRVKAACVQQAGTYDDESPGEQTVRRGSSRAHDHGIGHKSSNPKWMLDSRGFLKYESSVLEALRTHGMHIFEWSVVLILTVRAFIEGYREPPRRGRKRPDQ